jgi:hypothetical protein
MGGRNDAERGASPNRHGPGRGSRGAGKQCGACVVSIRAAAARGHAHREHAHQPRRARYADARLPQAHDFDAAPERAVDSRRAAQIVVSACFPRLGRRPAHCAPQVKEVAAAERNPLLPPKGAALGAVAPLEMWATGEGWLAAVWLFTADPAVVRLIVRG